MHILQAKYANGAAVLQHYLPNLLHGGLFIPTRKPLELGASVVVDVRFPELQSAVLIRGMIAWRRAGKRRMKLRAGLGVGFLASEERKREFILGVAEGRVVDLMQRRHRRLPVEIRVDWRGKSDRSWHISSLDDIGSGGAFVRTTEFLPVHSTVILEISAPGGERKLSLEAEVAWTRHTPGEEGMGLQFRCRDLGGARLLQELVRRLERYEEGAAQWTQAAG